MMKFAFGVMATIPNKTGQFTDRNYWDAFFKKRRDAFEWYGSYDDLSSMFERYLKPSDSILQIGCGNSTLADSLYDNGFQKIVSIDTAADAIHKQISRNANKRPALAFQIMDTTQLSYEDEHFEAVIDKGTLDALLPDEEGMSEYSSVAFKMIHEIQRVLSPAGGRYLVVTLAQKHVLQFWLHCFENRGYILRVHQLDADNGERDPNLFKYPVFMLIATKLRVQMIGNQVYEFCYGSEKKAQRFDSIDGVLERVEGGQEFARFCHMCRNSKLAEVTNISMPGVDGKTRYNISLVDKNVRSHSQYSVFIVPQGRESEWLYSHANGIRDLCSRTNASRLAVVSLCRDQQYIDIAAIKNELNSFVAKFAPADAADKNMDYLSVYEGVGNREIIARGRTEFNGEFVVEDVTVANGDTENVLRRLIFTKSPTLIQSEAKIVLGKTKSGNAKKSIDELSLCCDHHSSMLPAVAFACPHNRQPNDYPYHMSVIGLGGGSLVSYLSKLVPKATIEAVELDPVVLDIAEKHFGLKQGGNVKCLVIDGLRYIDECAENNRKFDVLFLDVAGSEQSDGLSCPPPQFITDEMIKLMASLLKPNGWLSLNVVTRDKSKCEEIEKNLRRHLPSFLAYKPEEDVNIVFICNAGKPDDPDAFNKRLNEKHEAFLSYSRSVVAKNRNNLKKHMKKMKV